MIIGLPVGLHFAKSSPPAHIPSNISLSGGIEHCPGGSPGDAVSCTFTSSSQAGSILLSLKVAALTNHHSQSTATAYRLSSIVGAPVENCQGSNQSVQTVIGGSATITQGWSDSLLTTALDPVLEFLNIQGSDSWSREVTWQAQQTVTITVEPGSQVSVDISCFLVHP
jgi:hypothetical protein